ncbi:MAG: helix-turn-helix domain-containing protein [Thiobacillus sp.]
MSIRVMSMVWERYPGGGSTLLALLALADWSDDNGRCYPSMASISKKIRLKPRRAQRIVHQLIEDGFVQVVGNEFGGAPGSTRQYRINLSMLTGVLDDTRTGVLEDTPSRETGVLEDAEGCTGRRETGVPQYTQTVIEPSITVSTGEQDRSPQHCPIQKIIDLYHECMPANPRCKVPNEARKRSIRQRWIEAAILTCKPFGYTTQAEGLRAWRHFFEVCAESKFLTGQVPGRDGKPPFLADIDFLFSPKGFAKCIENKYHRGAA